MLAALLAAATFPGCFPKAPSSRLQHFADLAPQPGQPAPSFRLETVDGEVVELSKLLGDRPVVLQLGSHSCPVFRYRRHAMAKLWEEYGDRVHFLVVYTREAHPVGSKSPYANGEWDILLNRLVGVRIREPADLRGRAAQAARSTSKLEIQVPVAVDGMDNATWEHFGAASAPAFVIDREGIVRAAQVWVQPAQIRRVLEELLSED